ncbi:MAG: nickel pincer cofactor biosynthesis protein LarC [Planctomycetota bacterium]
MRLALLEPFAGVAGDMLVGALVDAGAPFRAVRAALEALPLEGFTVSQRKVLRCGVTARKFRVKHKEDHHHRGLTTILKMLKKAKLQKPVRERAVAAFTLLGEAEAKVHGVSVDDVHFHEVGAVDAICDIVGAAAALHALEIDALHCRAMPLFHGSVKAAHGMIPLPAPATLHLMRGMPVYDSGLQGELVTPTGAACVAAWATFDPLPPLVPDAIGYGAGDRDPKEYPNVCRVMTGEAPEPGDADGTLSELVCDVDDATPQVLGHLLERLLEAGALDATLQPTQMKKGRPGTRVTALCLHARVPAIEEVLFREGTTLGVRRHAVDRTELPRKIVSVKTRFGNVRVKLGYLGREVVHAAPEYEDCRALAESAGVPLRQVLEEAVAQWCR